MAVPRLRVSSAEPSGTLRQASDEVELYHRTYTTLLRSSGETLLRVLEPSHAAMNSSLHPLAWDMEQPDLGAFLYSLRRLPSTIWRANVIVVGQESEAFARAGYGRIQDWEPLEAPARRRRWFDDGQGTLAVLLASTSDLDDAIPSLVAYQLEWNKLHALLRAVEPTEDPTPADVAAACGGSEADWSRLEESWPEGLAAFVDEVRTRKLHLRIRMLGGSQSGYARITAAGGAGPREADRPGAVGQADVLRLLQHALAREPRVHGAGASEEEIVDWVEANGPDYLLEELERFRTSRKTGSWENFLYYGARLYYESQPDDGPAWDKRRKAERELGITHISSRTGLRVSAQVIDLASLTPRGWTRGSARSTREARAHQRCGREHRVSARARRLQHPARDHDGA